MHALAALSPASGLGASAAPGIAASRRAVAAEGPVAGPTRDAIVAWNRTHDMAGLRSRGSATVRAIEDRRRSLVASRVLRLRPGVVVDVGCEDGWIAEAYAPFVRETVLVDLDAAMLARAKDRALPRARCVVGDATQRSLVPPGSADVVVLSAILEHLPRPQEALAAWAPALVPDGRFVVFVPADGPILLAKRVLKATRLGALARGVSLEPAPGHVVTFTRRRLARLLGAFGVVENLTFDPAVLGYAATVRVAPASRPVAGER